MKTFYQTSLRGYSRLYAGWILQQRVLFRFLTGFPFAADFYLNGFVGTIATAKL